MFEKNPDPTDRHAFNLNFHDAAEPMRDARNLKARAELYRRPAESLFDAKVIAVVLACARELEELAETVTKGWTEPPDFSD